MKRRQIKRQLSGPEKATATGRERATGSDVPPSSRYGGRFVILTPTFNHSLTPQNSDLQIYREGISTALVQNSSVSPGI